MKTRGATLILMVLSFNLAGCLPAAIVGGSAAGYYVGNDDRAVDEIVDDASITAAVNAKFLKDRNVSAWDINVDTRYGVVTLNGTVSSPDKEDRAIELASEVKGVKKIISKLTIVTP